MARRAGLGRALDRADLVLTGEGRFDAGSLAGKGTGRVIGEARRRGLPVAVVLPEAMREATLDCRIHLPSGRYLAAVALDAGLPHRLEAEVAFEWPPSTSAGLEKP